MFIRKIFNFRNYRPFVFNFTKHQACDNTTLRVVSVESTQNHLKYAFIVASSFLTYKVFKENFPRVSAATKFEGAPLVGHRKQYNFIADVVETSGPAVVYIEIKDTKRVDFFSGRPTTISNGSGFIIEGDGLILTNAHVVTNKPSARVEVRLFNGEVHTGVVEHVDMRSDLATVRIKSSNLPVMKLGNSSDLKPGEFVVAMGSPLALSNTVTCGVVSSTHRASEELGLHGKDMVYIQTDAAITFGNSGGPLVNLDGEAIGVNSMKVTAGISFAIPINYVKQFLAIAKKSPKALEGPKKLYMGITMLTLTPEILHELQQRNHQVPNDLKSGVLIWKVIIGSPAYNAGLQPGDIVTAINGKIIKHANDVYGLLNSYNNQPLKMMVIRNGKSFETHVTPEDLNS